MTFTDANPSFPYECSELRKRLGTPDSPAVHLAITSLAEHVLPLGKGSKLPAEHVRILALYAGSRGALMSLPIECVESYFLSRVDLPFDPAKCQEAYETKRTDWLGDAQEKLKEEGFDEPGDARKRATRYGWV